MRGRELAETWFIAGVGAWVWYSDGFSASAIFWAAFFICSKLDSVIESIDKVSRSHE
jgi:hypothetical protein